MELTTKKIKPSIHNDVEDDIIQVELFLPVLRKVMEL
jgi:hypothetical protein